MKALWRVLAPLSMMVAALGFQPSQALTYGQCMATYTNAGASCMFTPVGPNLWVYGYTQFSPDGVKVRITDLTGTITIAYCRGYFDCSAHVGPDHTGTDSVGPPAGGPLLCQVISGTRGGFGCSSGI